VLTRIPVTKNATAVHARHNKNVAPAIDLGCVAIVSSNADRKARQGFLIFVCLSRLCQRRREKNNNNNNNNNRRRKEDPKEKRQKRRSSFGRRSLSLSLSLCVCVCVSVSVFSLLRVPNARQRSLFFLCGQLGKFNCRNFSNVNPLFELEKLL
jgi:hypothetical protein